MAAPSRTRPGNPDRGWNDPPMFNFNAGVGQPGPGTGSSPRRMLNKRVAFPSTSLPQPGHAVLNPSEGPPILNPVLSVSNVQAPPPMQSPPIPIGLRDTPLGNQSTPISPILLLPPTADSSAPHAVPLVVPGLIPQQPVVSGNQPGEGPGAGLQEERMEDLMSRLSLASDTELLQHDVEKLNGVLDRYRPVLTMKVCEEIRKKLQVFRDCWVKGSLGNTVKICVTQLIEALFNEETDRANHLHLALVVDHISEVNQWMIGLKRLLHQQQLAVKERELLSQSRDAGAGVEDCSDNTADPTGSNTEGSNTTGSNTGAHGLSNQEGTPGENCDKSDLAKGDNESLVEVNKGDNEPDPVKDESQQPEDKEETDVVPKLEGKGDNTDSKLESKGVNSAVAESPVDSSS